MASERMKTSKRRHFITKRSVDFTGDDSFDIVEWWIERFGKEIMEEARKHGIRPLKLKMNLKFKTEPW